MNKIKIASLALVAAAPLCAQTTNYAASPPGYDSLEGGGYAYYFGNYSNGRYQRVDGEQRNKVMSIKEIAFRRDYRTGSTYYNARNWTSVTLDMCDGDVATMVNTWTMNYKSTPTRVFSSSITWPGYSTYPTSTPAPWGGVAGEYSFPFNKGTWLSLGQKDILADWQFKGGTCLNGYSWTTSSSRSYYLDGWSALSPTSSLSGAYSLVPSTRLNNGGAYSNCNDSAMTTTTGAYMYTYSYVYGKYYSSIHWRDKVRIYGYSYYTGYDNPTIHAYGALPDATGVDIGTGCNKLHMHPASIFLILSTKTLPQQYNSSGYTGYFETLVPFNPAWGGFTFAAQAAWADSKTGKLGLSQAVHNTLPTAMPEPSMRNIYHYNGANATGNGPYNYNYMNHIRRYGY